MAFISDIKQFPTPAAFAAYLNTLPQPNWPGAGPIGSTGHNTYRPTAAQWRGKPTMESMISTYIGKGWDRGPHFYFVAGAPKPAHNGIWIMTSPTMPGTHAGACNTDHFGCELVGDFQATAPSLPLQRLFLDTLVILHTWARIGAVLNAHRDCMPGRTCPGNAMYAIMPRLQAQLAVRLAPIPDTPQMPDPLRAEKLPAPGGKTVACSAATAGFYAVRGGAALFGLARLGGTASGSSGTVVV